MARKTTTELQKTEIQALAETLADKLDWPGLEAIVPLALGVMERFRHAYALDPEKCYEVSELADRWGWKDAQSFKERLEKSDVRLYEVGKQKTIFVQLKDIMEAPKCLHTKRSTSAPSEKRTGSSTTTAGRT